MKRAVILLLVLAGFPLLSKAEEKCPGLRAFLRSAQSPESDFQDDIERVKSVPYERREELGTLQREMQEHRKQFREIEAPACAQVYRDLRLQYMTFTIAAVGDLRAGDSKAANEDAASAKSANEHSIDELKLWTSEPVRR